MNTQHLKYAIEVARTGSITQAADNLYIGQPSLSKAIKELEDSLGIVIFKRTSKGAVPTEKGAEFLKYARTVMLQVEKMEALYRPGNPNRQELSISIPRSSYIASAAAEYIAQMNVETEMTVSLCETGSMQTIRRVEQNHSALGVIRYWMKDENYFLDYLAANKLKHELVWEFDALVILSKKHPLSERTPLKAESLFQYIEVVMEDEAIPYVNTREAERPDRRDDKKIVVSDRGSALEVLSKAHSTYLWGAPQPEEMLTRFGLIQRACQLPEGRCRDVLIYPRGHEFSGVERHFINKLFEYRNQLAFQNYQ